jgi:spoIIIJ-associated protein
MDYREFTGKSVREAIQKACQELNVEEGLLDVRVVEESARGFLGLVGQRDAIIRVRKRDILKEIMATGEIPRFPETPEASPAEPIEADGCENADTCDADELTSAPDFRPEPEPIDEELSHALTEALPKVEAFLSGLLERMRVEAKVLGRIDRGALHIDIVGDGSGLLIGKKGQTLDALQYLASKVINKDAHPGKKIEVVVDTENYRERKHENLKEKALKISGMAKRTLRPVWLDPMPADERRIIHMILAQDREVYTKSQGEGAMRRIVVYPRRAMNRRRGR